MTDEQIIEMAVQAGFKHPNPHDGYMGLAYDRRDGTDTGPSLEAFAKLVAEHEREACAEHYLGIMRNAVKEAVERERGNFRHLLRQMHDSISLQSDPDGLKLRGEA